MSSDITLREAVRSDLPAVLALVQELADFEKEPYAVTSDLAEYHDAFESGLIDVVVAERGGDIIAMTVCYMTFSTWKGKMYYLEDFYVQPQYRSEGIGQRLFDHFLATAKRKGANLVKWQVLDWNEGAIRFYERNQATIERQWYNGKIVF